MLALVLELLVAARLHLLHHVGRDQRCSMRICRCFGAIARRFYGSAAAILARCEQATRRASASLARRRSSSRRRSRRRRERARRQPAHGRSRDDDDDAGDHGTPTVTTATTTAEQQRRRADDARLQIGIARRRARAVRRRSSTRSAATRAPTSPRAGDARHRPRARHRDAARRPRAPLAGEGQGGAQRAQGAPRRPLTAGARAPRGPDALGLVEHDLAQPHRVRGDLDALVGAQQLERLVERELAVGDQAHEHLGGRGADVREVLLARGVDVEVVGARVLADDHALVDLLAGADEQRRRAPAGSSARTAPRRPERSATSAPVGRVRSSPAHGSQRSKTWCRMPVPRVSVRNSVRKPIRPRAGTRYSIRTQPVPWLTICSRRPLRSASSCVTTPT